MLLPSSPSALAQHCPPPPPLQQHSFCPDTSSCLQPQGFLVPLPGSFHPAHLSGGSPSSLAFLQVTQPSGALCPAQTLTQPLNAPSHSRIWRARQAEDARNWQTLRAPQLGLSCDGGARVEASQRLLSFSFSSSSPRLLGPRLRSPAFGFHLKAALLWCKLRMARCVR